MVNLAHICQATDAVATYLISRFIHADTDDLIDIAHDAQLALLQKAPAHVLACDRACYAWMRTTAERLYWSISRSRDRTDGDIPANSDEHPAQLADTELGLDLQAILDHLPESSRSVMELKLLGYPLVEIAERLHITPDTARRRLSRGRQRLRELLQS